MVEGRTPEREVRGFILTQVAVLCPWARYIYFSKSTGNTQEAVAPSRHDWKIGYWDVKQNRNETKQNLNFRQGLVKGVAKRHYSSRLYMGSSKFWTGEIFTFLGNALIVMYLRHMLNIISNKLEKNIFVDFQQSLELIILWLLGHRCFGYFCFWLVMFMLYQLNTVIYCNGLGS